MWTCPICGNSGSVKRFCGNCGFDLTSDAVAAPTFCELPPSCSAARANARRRWFALNSSYSVQKNQIVDGRIRTGTQTQQERFDSQAGAYAVPGSRVVDSQVRTGETSAGQSPLHHSPYGPGPDPAGSPYGSQANRTAWTSQTAQSSRGPQAASGFNPQAGAYAVPGSRVVDGQVRTGEAPEGQSPLHHNPYGPGPDPAGSPYGSKTSQTSYSAQTSYDAQTAQTSYNSHAGTYATPGSGQQIPLHHNPYGSGPAVQPGQGVRQAAGQAGRPMQQQVSSTGNGRSVFRTVLGVIMAIIALMALITLVSGEAGRDSTAVFFSMLFFASMAWLLFKKRKQK